MQVRPFNSAERTPAVLGLLVDYAKSKIFCQGQVGGRPTAVELR